MHVFSNSGVEIRNLGYDVLSVDVSNIMCMSEFIVIYSKGGLAKIRMIYIINTYKRTLIRTHAHTCCS